MISLLGRIPDVYSPKIKGSVEAMVKGWKRKEGEVIPSWRETRKAVRGT